MLWVKKVSSSDKGYVSRAVVQATKRGTYMSVQDRHGVILGTLKWPRRITYDEAAQALAEGKIVVEGSWRKPREGVFVAYVRDIP